jgi:hypothetical protein
MTVSQLGLDHVAARSDYRTDPDGSMPDAVASTVSTTRDASGYGLVGNHVYTVVGQGRNEITGQDVTYLSNPHGREGTVEVPTRELDGLTDWRATARGIVPAPGATVEPPAPPANFRFETPNELPPVQDFGTDASLSGNNGGAVATQSAPNEGYTDLSTPYVDNSTPYVDNSNAYADDSNTSTDTSTSYAEASSSDSDESSYA